MNEDNLNFWASQKATVRIYHGNGKELEGVLHKTKWDGHYRVGTFGFYLDEVSAAHLDLDGIRKITLRR